MKRIVILGAGFGGLRTALRLGGRLSRYGLERRYEVILVDRNDHHTYTPLLYEVATTSKETADICRLHEISAYKIAPIIEGLPVRFLEAEVESLSLTEGHIHLGDGRRLPYDYLVIAVGSETNYFAIPGLKEEGLPLKNFQDAIRIRDAVWNLAMTEKPEIKIVVGGGGSTGVELAAEFKAWRGELERNFPRCRLDVTIVQGNVTLLPGFHAKVIDRVNRRLKKLGVHVLTNERAASVANKKVVTKSGREIPYDVLVWAGGTRATSTVSELPLRSEEKGRIEVLGPMECFPETPALKLHPKIYALGDAVCFYHPVTKKPVAGVARAAISEANVVAHNILEDIKHEQGLTPAPFYRIYHPVEYPYIIPVGGKYAVAKVGPLIISGMGGWILKGLVELNYLISIMPLGRAFKIWLKGLKIFIQNDRLG